MSVSIADDKRLARPHVAIKRKEIAPGDNAGARVHKAPMQGAADRATERAAAAGFAYAGLAQLIWGFFPVYFKLLGAVPPWEVLAHRALWAFPSIALVVTALAGWRSVATALARPRTRWTLVASGVVIAVNWLVFIWATTADRVLEVSLGYFLSPLLSVAFGVLLLGERLTRAQAAALALVIAGVTIQTLGVGQPPYAALAIGGSFAIYSVLRKRVAADASTGMFIETLFLAPVALLAIVWLEAQGVGHLFGAGPGLAVLLVLGGPLTVAPLTLFALGARRLRLSTIGMTQYIAPTMHFGIGLAFGEAFTPSHAVTFLCIWSGIAIFVVSGRSRRVAAT